MKYLKKIEQQKINGKTLKLTYFEPLVENGLSALTHFISHYYKENESVYYKEKAIKIAQSYADLLNKTNDNKLCAEQIIEQWLFQYKDESIPFKPSEKPKFKFIDLFAGIGGIRLAMQSIGGECVFSSEWDKFSQQTYSANFGDELLRAHYEE